MHRLPSRIAAVMLGTILVFVLTIAACVLWLTQALDDQARTQSLAQIRNARAGLLEKTRMITLDYAKWDAIPPLVAGKDVSTIYDSIGISATIGQAVQIVVIWGGTFAEDIGWSDDGVQEARPGRLDPGTLGQAERRLAQIPIGAYDGVEFFAWRDGDLFVLGASRIENGLDTGRSAVPDEHIGRLLMGHRLTEEVMTGIGDNYMLTGLGILRHAPADRLSVPLLGVSNDPVAYIAWDDPRPGSTMLRRMLLPLLGVSALAAMLTLFGMAMVRRNAQHLVLAEERSSKAARTDALTGLPNRTAFSEILIRPARAGRRAVLFLDVNDFKRINDSIGHEAGDQVVIGVAQRLTRFTGPDCFLARIAGDEFVFVVTDTDAEGRVRQLAHLTENAMATPFSVLGHQMQISLAMGYAVQSMDDMAGSDLVRQADLAMYEAKRHKGQQGPSLVAFSAVIEQASRDALAIEQGLRRALAQPGELAIAYQPIVGTEGQLERAEALARWTSPTLGVVSPDRFIAVAEQAGLIVELGHRLFELICNDLVAHPSLRVSLNISTLQLMAPDFVSSLVSELASRRIDPTRIEIELTEAVVVDDPRLAAQRLRELRAAGFSIALDDFGTGYSSVGYLRNFGFDTLKIDRSFVSMIRGSAEGVAVVDAMIRMAHGLKLRVVCEGVETADELELLRELGSDLAQGYHLDRPLPIQVLIERWLGNVEPQAAVA